METNINSQILDQILKTTYTKKQVIRRFRLIRDFLNLVFFDLKPGTDFKQALALFEQNLLNQKNSSESKELFFLENLGESFFKLFNPETFHLELEQLQKSVLSVKTVTLYLPFEIPDVEIDKLGMWFKKNLGNNILFEIIFDPGLIGGAALSFNGVFKDYSLKQKIAENKQDIEKLLTGFK